MTRPAAARRAGVVRRRARPRAGASTTSPGAPGLALGELLADAQDRAQAGLDRPAELAADQLVGLAGVAAPLGVADDDPRREARRASAREISPV